MSAIKFNVHLKDFHKAHKKRNNKEGETSTWKEFKLIISTMGDILGDEIIKTGKATLPGVSWLFMVVKQKNTFILKEASRLEGKKVKGFNDHSDGFVCRIKLIIGPKGKDTSDIYYFRSNRTLKRVKLRDEIRNNKDVIYNYLTVNR